MFKKNLYTVFVQHLDENLHPKEIVFSMRSRKSKEKIAKKFQNNVNHSLLGGLAAAVGPVVFPARRFVSVFVHEEK